MSETIPNRILSNFDSKCRCQILSSKNAKDINVPHSVPLLGDQRDTIVEMRREDNVGVVVRSSLDAGWYLEHWWLEEHQRVGKDGFDHLAVSSVMCHPVVIGEVLGIDLGAILWIYPEIVFLQDCVAGWIPHTVLCPYAFAKLPPWIALPPITGIIVIFRKPGRSALGIYQSCP